MTPLRAGRAPAPAARWSPPDTAPDLVADARLVAAGAATVLAVASIGSASVAALLLGAATRSRRGAAAALLAVLAAAIRFRTAALDDLAGIQSVLGLAVEVGPATAAASSWLSALAVLLVAAPLPDAPHPLLRWAPAVPCGLLAAALAAGPGPSELVLRVATSAAGVVLALAVVVAGGEGRGERLRPWVAVAAGLAAVVLAGWPA